MTTLNEAILKRRFRLLVTLTLKLGQGYQRSKIAKISLKSDH